jgi:signal transduction histidine kinase
VTDRERELEARVSELEAARARIVDSSLRERRRLERRLHDGAQQRLVALSLTLRLAQSRLAKDPDTVAELLAGAQEELKRAQDELRDLARGIHPAILTDRGLRPAIDALAGRSPVPVDLELGGVERLPAPVEAAAYFVAAEALANAAKHAEASCCRVSVGRHNGSAFVEVADDGVGGADPERGSGLRCAAERVGALDGRLEVVSPAGEGTRVRAEIPCAE